MLNSVNLEFFRSCSTAPYLFILIITGMFVLKFSVAGNAVKERILIELGVSLPASQAKDRWLPLSGLSSGSDIGSMGLNLPSRVCAASTHGENSKGSGSDGESEASPFCRVRSSGSQLKTPTARTCGLRALQVPARMPNSSLWRPFVLLGKQIHVRPDSSPNTQIP